LIPWKPGEIGKTTSEKLEIIASEIDEFDTIMCSHTMY
jgi:hypothetical protein